MNNVTLNIDEDVMGARIQHSSRQNNSPFSGLNKIVASEYGQKKLREGGAISFGKSRIKFDAKDIQNPNDRTDAMGASGLAWYAKCGFVESEFGGFENTLLHFDDKVMPEVEKEVPQMPKAESVEEAVQAQNEQILNGESTRNSAVDNQLDDSYNAEDVGEGFDGAVWNKAIKSSKKDFNEEEAREHLRKIFGDKIPVDIVDPIIDTLASGAWVVGRTYADYIQLSRMGERGVEWHEAFHRVLEILASDRVRNRIYRAYENATSRYTMSEHEIGEALADQFMAYMMNKPAINLKGIK